MYMYPSLSPRALSRVPCAVQYVLTGYLFHTKHCIYVNPKLPVFPTSTSPLGIHIIVLYICVSVSALQIDSSGPAFSVQSLSRVQQFATPWTAACQFSLSITNSWRLLKLMSIELVRPSNHLILHQPLIPSSIFPSIRVFSSESALRITWPK